MKTLNEVIKNLEDGTEHLSAMLISKETWNDALQYLKEYKANREDPDGDHQQLEKAQNLLWEFYQNDPLSWDELKSMEGKPVWVEVYDPIDEKTGWHTASWKLIEFINDEYFDVRNSDGEQECFYKSENDCYCWQAYRKERE